MRFEELLDQVDSFGPFQLWNVALMALPRVLLPMHFLLPIFLAAVPAHHCALPGAPANFSHQDAWPTCQEPDGTLSSCLCFTQSQALPNTMFWGVGQSPGQLEGEPSTGPCPQVEYDCLEFSTIATEWDLVCKQKDLNKATSTFFFACVLVGAMAFGLMGGVQFGQHCLLLVAYVSSLVLGLASIALVSYIMFVITCSVTGMALAGFTIIVMLLEMEWLDVGHCTEAGVLDSIFWTRDVCMMLLALVRYLIRDWLWNAQERDVAVGLCLKGLLLSPRWVPESAHWLLTQGHVEEAQYLLHCSRLNGWPMGVDSLSQETLSKVVTERVVQRPLYLDLFRTPRLQHISLCCIVMWFGVNFSYYGMSLDVSRLGLDMYQTQLLFGAVEVPSKLLVDLLVRHVGHCLVQAGMLLGTTLALGSSLLACSLPEPLFPPEMWAWCTTLVVIGKSFSEAAFTTAYLFTSELYPTVLSPLLMIFLFLQQYLIGTTGMGLTALVCQLWGSLAPLVALVDGVWLSLLKLTYGGLPCWLACTALLLPETKQVQLPETIQDVERSALSSLQKEKMPMKQVQD
ncbi:LOW QUALITY PROTEIN: solute carrier family 22 member 7 [Lycaon pictus]